MIEIQQEPDRIPPRVIRTTAIVIAVAIAASIGAAVMLAGPSLGAIAHPAVAGPERLDSQLFREATAAERGYQAADVRLHAYGWVDRSKGIVHVPLDVAIERYLAEHRR
jgi:hypothetical protein